ncbi:MAG TPA: hypothetical protein GXX15_01455 [Clostridia bacterium]|nr:hypothetical protein [Clostridia bacterium]
MNWSKAKTVMIVTFAILNMILYLTIVKMNKLQFHVLTPMDISSLERVLSENNIVLNTSIPTKSEFLPLIRVEREVFNKGFVLDNFIKGQQYQEYKEGKYSVFNFGDKTIKIDEFSLYYFEKSDKFKNLSSSQKEEYIKNFIRDYNLEEKNAYLEKSVRDKEVKMTYYQTYRGYFIDDGCMEGKMTDESFVFSKRWFNFVTAEKGKKEIIDVTYALLKLVEIKTNSQPMVIKEINLGYYFNWANARKGEAVPVWRVVTEEGTKYYINAYTGNVEEGK